MRRGAFLRAVKLRGKLLLTIVPVVAGAVLALGCAVYVQLRADGEQSLRREMDTLLMQTEARLQARLDTVAANARVLASATLLRRYARERHAMIRPAVSELFADYREAHPEYREIRLLALDGYEDTRVARAELSNAREEEGGTAWFREAMAADGPLDTVLRSPDDGALVLLHTRPVRAAVPGGRARESGAAAALLALTVELDELAEEAAAGRIGNGGYLEVLDAHGAVAFGPDPERFGTVLPELEAVFEPEGEAVRRTLHGKSASVRGWRTPSGLQLIAVVPDGELAASQRRLALTVAVATVLAIAAVGAFVFLALSRLVLHPLDLLGRQAKAIGEGRFEGGTPVASEDELGDLGRAFETMSVRLGKTLEELRGSHARIEELAYRDSLTGLPNRRRFLELLGEAANEVDESGGHVALLFLDLDDFKRINDTLGHDKGDELLIESARRLSALSESDEGAHVARLGGDEFTVLFPVPDGESCAALARSVVDTLAEPLCLSGHELSAATSVGVALYPDDADSIDELMRCADAAMYEAKRRGKSMWRRFDAAMQAQLEQTLQLESDLRAAVLDPADTQLHLHYQPQLDVAGGTYMGVEALLRWDHPELGRIPPDRFVPIAERTGLIDALGRRVLADACAQWLRWRAAGLGSLRVAVNVSPRQFALGDVHAEVVQVLAATGMPPAFLEVEVTESCMIEAPQEVITTLHRLRELGVRVAMDDFGTGHSSLGALLDLPIDTLKIDRSFISGLAPDEPKGAIVRTVLTLARTLGLEAVGEGVETEAELAFLREGGCELAQGYLMSAPLSAEAVTELLLAAKASNAA